MSLNAQKKNPPPPPKGVAVGILGGQKSPGNVMNCPEKKNLTHPTPGGGGGGVGGQNFKSPGNFMNCRENR